MSTPTEAHAHPDHRAPVDAGRADHHGHDSPPGRQAHGRHDKHAGHDPAMFRRLFWWNLALAVPVLVF